ncbi:phosphatase PAP2 family protein [Umezawaea sp. Da 62-37]|uniref:phosphatase PAP2 family protein n=1 Tax=Umezawaea sp. Da 62-37 TaxID=3075927 RepID=UPI0028F71A4F|nr:phosphatase PAP2 family protein [Umezawaea sp. Da 62-37]WNV83515.1 phosphatase PAP2 family protein [Umezawaea sp. Da 62-37]
MSRAVVLLVGVLLVGVSTALGVFVRDEVPALDVRFNAFDPLHTRPLTYVAEWISFVLSPGLATIVLLGVAVRSWLAKDFLLFRIGVLLGLCWCTVLVRYAYRRVRPIDFPKWSYPSGHVTAVTALAFTSVVACAWLARRWVRVVAALAVTAVALTAVSRVVLRMHWFTDTAGAVTAVVGVGLLSGLALGLVGPGVMSNRDRT